MNSFIEKHYGWILFAFCVVYVLQTWLCSGNLAPYAATLENPHFINEKGWLTYPEKNDTGTASMGCYYIANYDHMHYLANYDMLKGKPEEVWNWAYLLRRPLL